MPGTPPGQPPATPGKVAVYSPTGQLGLMPEEDFDQDAKIQGYREARPEDVHRAIMEREYGGAGQTLAAFGEGTADSLTFGLSTAVERGLGVSKEGIEARKEVHPIAHGAGTALGIIAPLALSGGLASTVEGANVARAAVPLGEAVAKGGLRGAAELTAPALISRVGRAAEHLVESAGLPGAVGRILPAAAGGAAEGIMYGASDINERAFLGDPQLTWEKAASELGLAGLFGGAIGGAGKGLSELVPGNVREAAIDKLADVEANRNAKAAGAIQSTINRAQKTRSEQGLKEIHREMGERGLVGVGSTPKTTYARAQALIKQGRTEAEQLTQAADGVPNAPTWTFNDLRQEIEPDIMAEMQSKGSTHGAANIFKAKMDDFAQAYGDRELGVSDLHALRTDVDKTVYNFNRSLDPFTKPVAAPMKQFRDELADKLRNAMDETGVGQDAWNEALRKQEVGIVARMYARHGMVREVGNNPIPLTSILGTIAGGAAGAGPIGALATGVGTYAARKYSSGAIGAGARALRNLLDRGASEEAVAAAARRVGGEGGAAGAGGAGWRGGGGGGLGGGGAGLGTAEAVQKGQLSDLVNRIRQPDGGFTYNPMHGTEPTEGFALSIHPERSATVDAENLTADALHDYLSKNRDLLSQEGNHLGAWHDPQSHKVFLDVSTVAKDEKEAAELARQHDQIAYFDLKNGRSVTVNKDATSGGAAMKGTGTDGPEAAAAPAQNDGRPGAERGGAGEPVRAPHGQEDDARGAGSGAGSGEVGAGRSPAEVSEDTSLFGARPDPKTGDPQKIMAWDALDSIDEDDAYARISRTTEKLGLGPEAPGAGEGAVATSPVPGPRVFRPPPAEITPPVSVAADLTPPPTTASVLATVPPAVRPRMRSVAQGVSLHLRQMAAEAEPEVTKSLRAMSGNGLELVDRGLKYKLKGTARLHEKVTAQLATGANPDEAAAHVRDALRYTFRIPNARYVQKTDEAIKKMQGQGYRLVRFTNYWRDTTTPYNGINTVWQVPNGTQMEVQFHTPLSYPMKDRLHPIYEKVRAPGTTATEAAEYDRQMNEMVATLPHPGGVDTFTKPTVEPVLPMHRLTDETFQYTNDAVRDALASQAVPGTDPTGGNEEDIASAGRAKASVRASRRAKEGATTRVISPHFPAGERAKYALVEAPDLVASHKGPSFTPNAKYPEGVQERPYHLDTNEQEKVRMGAQSLNPNLLLTDTPTAVDGPPIVASGKPVVLGGNGRTMMIQNAYKAGGGEEYRKSVIEKAPSFGLSPDDARSMQAPAIVRRLDTVGDDSTKEQQIAAVRRFNEGMTQGLSPQARAVAEARAMSPETVEQFGALLGGEDERSLRDLMRETPEHFVDALSRDGIITAQNRATWVAGGNLTDEGKDRIEGMFLGRVVGTPDRLAASPPSILNKVERTVPYLLKVASINPEADEIPAVRKALDLLGEAKRRRLSIGDLVSQHGLFGTEPAYDAEGEQLAQMFDQLGPRQIGERFRQWAQVAAVDPRQGALFGNTTKPEDVKATLFGRASGYSEGGVVTPHPAAKRAPDAAVEPAEATEAHQKLLDLSTKADKKLQLGVKVIFSDDGPAAAIEGHFAKGGLVTQEDYPDVATHLRDFGGNLDRLADAVSKETSGIADHAPGTASAAHAFAARVVGHLGSALAPEPQKRLLDPAFKPNSSDLQSFNRHFEVASHGPVATLHHLAKGTLHPDHLAASQLLFPKLHAHAQQLVAEKMAEHLGKEKHIKHRLRGPLGMFLGADLDHAHSPESLIAAQNTYAAAAAPAPAPQSQGRSRDVATHVSERSASPSQGNQQRLARP